MTTTEIIVPKNAPPEAQAAIRDAGTLAHVAADVIVDSAESMAGAAEHLQAIKGAAKRLVEKRKAITDPLDASKKAAMALFAPAVMALEDAERRVKRAIGTYHEQEAAARRRAQAQADELARKERERLQRQAEKAAEAGRTEKAERLEAQAAVTTAAVVRTEAPKVAGTGIRKTWTFEITNPAAVPREYCMPDESKIRKIVSALQGDTNIAGVRAYAKTVIASRSN